MSDVRSLAYDSDMVSAATGIASNVAKSYVAVRPDGARVYIKSTAKIAYAVFTKRLVQGKWERVAIIEDRAYVDELYRVNGAYAKYPGLMSPETKALETATWYRVVGNYAEAMVVGVRETRGKRRAA